MLAGGGIGEVEGAGPAVLQVHLALDQVGPSRRGGVFEVGHEHLRSGVQGVDDHLAVHRPGDLHPAVLEVFGDGPDGPVAGADGGGLVEEVRAFAEIEAGLALGSVGEQLAAAGVELAVQVGDQR